MSQAASASSSRSDVAAEASTPAPTRVSILIVGTGFAGLGMAVRLKQDGIEDFVILERAGDVGGTWRDNAYPGCACDVESNLYSFSFAPNPTWTQSFSPQGEIHAYLRGVAEKYQLLEHVRFHHEVTRAQWNEETQRWTVETSRGTFEAQFTVSAVGAFSEPSIPDLKGLDTFEGKTFHSARWDHAYDLTGKKVAVIGTGASAIQFVPEVQPKVAKLTLFQRTAPWILPRRNKAFGVDLQERFRKFPTLQLLERARIYAFRELFYLGFRYPAIMKRVEDFARSYLARSVPDPVLRKKLTPDYRIGCKRILLSSTYLKALTKPNVDVVTDGIAEVRARSIVDRAGVEHPVDAILFGTGFHVTDIPFGKYVRNAQGKTLDDVWNGSPRAHLGTTISGFPNSFILLGPNTGLGHTSVIYMIESQIEHAVNALRYVRQHGFATFEPRADAQEEFITQVDALSAQTVWMRGGCQSYYVDRTGRNSAIWPGPTYAFNRRVAAFDPKEYVLRQANEAPAKSPPRAA